MNTGTYLFSLAVVAALVRQLGREATADHLESLAKEIRSGTELWLQVAAGDYDRALTLMIEQYERS